MSQQSRKEQEGVVVRRLTIGAGAAALGLTCYFTSAAVTAVPVAFGAQPASDAREPGLGVEQLDDHVFVRTVHVQAPRGPAGGVQAAAARPAGGASAPAAAASRPAGTGAAGSAPGAQPVAQPVAAPTPRPTPVATTGGTTPPK
jgi:hypothetical protein